MKIQKLLFYGIICLILILLIFNYKMSSLKDSFVKGCQIDYKPYIDNDTCPCKSSNSMYSSPFITNFSKFDINMSIN